MPCFALKKVYLILIACLILFKSASAEYIFYHGAVGQAFKPISPEEHAKIYPILLNYQFPMCLSNLNLLNELKPDAEGFYDLAYDEEGFVRKKINELKRRGELPLTLQVQFMPKTVYELCFILNLLDIFLTTNFDDRARNIFFDINFMSRMQDSFKRVLKKDRRVDFMLQWNENDFNKEVVDDFYSGTKDLAFLFNNIVLKYLNQFTFDKHWPNFAQKIVNQINENQENIKKINAAEKELSQINPKGENNKELIARIHELVGNIWDDKVDLMLSDPTSRGAMKRYNFEGYNTVPGGYKYVLGLNNQVKADNQELSLGTKNQKILLDVVELEVSAHGYGDWVLYRGSILENDKELLIKQEKPYSLSYGNSLFGGLIQEAIPNGAMAFWYMNDRGGYALSIPIINYLMNGLSRKLFFILPLTVLASFYLSGEHFHARSKVFIDEKHIIDSNRFTPYMYISGFYGSVHLSFEHIRAEPSYFKTREDFESAFHDFFKIFKDNIFEIKP